MGSGEWREYSLYICRPGSMGGARLTVQAFSRIAELESV
jgi:hypothetical protein